MKQDTIKCKGCETTTRDKDETWGARGHFSKLSEEGYHLLKIMVKCIRAATPGAEITIATCIWKCDESKQQTEALSVLNALQEAAKNDCQIRFTKPLGQTDSEYQSIETNAELKFFADNNANVSYDKSSPWNHAKFIAISALTLNNDTEKGDKSLANYFGLDEGTQIVNEVCMITSHNLSEFDARKYQDLSLTWNWGDCHSTEKTPASFVYEKCINYYEQITKYGSKKQKYDNVEVDKNTQDVGLLYYPRELRGNDKEDDSSYADSDPIVQFFRRFKKIDSIKIAMAYWQGVKPYNGRYTFRRRGVTDHIITRLNEENTDVSVVINQIANPINHDYYFNPADPEPILRHYKENALAVPEFFKLRDTIAEKKNIPQKSVPIFIVNDNSQQHPPYVHSKYLIVEGTPNDMMEPELKESNVFLWAGSSNIDNYGAWDNAEITVIFGNNTKQGAEIIAHYEDNFRNLVDKGRVFGEDTRIFGGYDKHGKLQPITYGYYKEDGSRDLENMPLRETSISD